MALPTDPHPEAATSASADTAQPTRAFIATLVVLAFVMNAISRGVTETFAVFLLPVEKDLGVARSAMTATYSIYMLTTGLGGPFAGQLIDRFGARATYGTGLAVMGGGYLLAGSVSEIWQYYVCVGVLGGIGSCTLGMVIASSLLTRWFTQRLGSIIALPYAAMGLGMLVFPPLTQLLLETLGWRMAHRVLGALVLALLIPVMLLPLERMTAGSPAWQSLRRQRVAEAGSGWTVRAAMGTAAFWGMFSILMFTSIAAYAALPQSVAFLIERGFEPLVAASAFGSIGIMSTLGIVGIGVLSDRIGRLKAATWSYVFSVSGLACLLAVAYWPSLWFVYGFVIFFGGMQGARGPVIVAMAANVFRGGNIGSIFGTLSLAQGLGGAIGSWWSGILHDATGDYVVALSFSIGFSFLSALIFWTIPAIRNEHEPPGR
jgi:MFS family permease